MKNYIYIYIYFPFSIFLSLCGLYTYLESGDFNILNINSYTLHFFYTCEALSGFCYANLSINGGGEKQKKEREKEKKKKKPHVWFFFTVMCQQHLGRIARVRKMWKGQFNTKVCLVKENRRRTWDFDKHMLSACSQFPWITTSQKVREID